MSGAGGDGGDPERDPVRALEEASLRGLEAELARIAPPPAGDAGARVGEAPRDDATEVGLPVPADAAPRPLGEIDLGRLLDDLVTQEDHPSTPPGASRRPAPASASPLPGGASRIAPEPPPSGTLDAPAELEGTVGRRRLLEALAAGSSGATRARLLAAAAELAADDAEAEAAWARAAEADPGDPAVARGARLRATAAGRLEDARRWLDAEARMPLGPAERASVAQLRAEVLRALGDLPEAERAARSAAGPSGPGLAGALATWGLCLARGRDAEAATALRKAADAAGDDGPLRALLLERIARAAEGVDRPRRALEAWQEAARLDPSSLAAHLGAARVGLRRAPAGAWIEGLLAAGEHLGGRTGEAFRRAAAVEARRRGRPAAEILAALGAVEDPPSLRLRAELAAAARDDAQEVAALDAWVAGTREGARAEALAHLAMAHARAGRGEAARRALGEAARLDPTLAALRFARERVAPGTPPRAFSPSRPPAAPDAPPRPGDTLAHAARRALDVEDPVEERAALLRAGADQEEPTTTEVLGLDAAAEAGELDDVRAHLERERGRRAGGRRLGATLALVDLARFVRDEERAGALLHEAREEATGDPLVTRPLALAEAADHPRAAAALMLAEASAADGPRAAFAAAWGARLLAGGGSDPGVAVERARLAAAAHPAALWVAETHRRRAGDATALADAHEALAAVHGGAGDDLEVSVRRFRAGLERAARDPVAATSALEATLAAHVGDALLLDFVERLHEATDPARVLGWLERAAAAVPAPLAEGVTLHLAARLEERAHLDRAAGVYARLATAEGAPRVAAGRGRDRVDLALGRHEAVVERWNDRARRSTSADARRGALADLADLHVARGDGATAAACWDAVLELSPGDPEALRALEAAAMEAGREDALPALAVAWLERPAPPGDVARALRVALRRLDRGTDEDASERDALLLAHGPRAALDPWLARQLEAAAHGAGDRGAQALAWRAAAAVLSTPLERASAAFAAASLSDAPAAERAELLAGPCRDAPEHPLAGELRARLLDEAGRAEEAAVAYEQAAGAARATRRVAALWLRAGVLWQDVVGRPERAARALERAAQADVAHGDVYPRLAALLEIRGDRARLAHWTHARIGAGGDPALVAELHARLAADQQALGDARAARASLEAALAARGDRADLLEPLARAYLAEGEIERAAQTLVRLGAVSERRDVLRWVFLTLGELFAGPLPDPDRALAALARAVELAPRDAAALEALARFHDAQGRPGDAATRWAQLVEADLDAGRERAHRLAWAASLHRAGDLGGAEQAIAPLREAYPDDPEVLSTWTALVRARGDARALAGHLEALTGQLRRAVERAPTRPGPWVAFSNALADAGRADAAACVASAAAALGHHPPELEARLDPTPLGIRACTPDLDALLTPRQLDDATRGALALAEPALDRVAPFDPRTVGAERLRDAGFVREAEHVAGWFGLPTPALWATDALPRACAAIGPAPAVLVGRELLRITTLDERTFLFARALKVAAAGLTVAMRSHPTTLKHLLAALLRLEAPEHPAALPGVPEVDDLARRLPRSLPRKIREPLGARLRTLSERPDLDGSRLGLAASQLGDRVALAAVGSVSVAFGAMLKLAGVLGAGDDAGRRRRALGEVPEAAALLTFAISDAFFEARRRAGAEAPR